MPLWRASWLDKIWPESKYFFFFTFSKSEKSCESGGLIANEQLETNKKNIFVAGDVASYYDPLLGKQKRIEHHDNAFVTGKLAGQNMTGE